MDIHIEKEYKIIVSKQQFDTLCQRYQPLQFIEQRNQYFDTSNKDIQKKKGAMRIRTCLNTHLFTLKLPSDQGLVEYECEVESNDVQALQCDRIQTLLQSLSIPSTLHPTTSLLTKRAVYENEYAQLCFDISEYEDTIDYEIEYEFKKEHNGRVAFNDILSNINVVYSSNCISKIQRALHAKMKRNKEI